MSIVDYSVLKSGDSGQDPPFKSDESGLHGDAEFPIAVYHADVTDNFVSWHWHEELEFGFAVEGSVLMECGKNKHILKEIFILSTATLFTPCSKRRRVKKACFVLLWCMAP